MVDKLAFLQYQFFHEVLWPNKTSNTFGPRKALKIRRIVQIIPSFFILLNYRKVISSFSNHSLNHAAFLYCVRNWQFEVVNPHLKFIKEFVTLLYLTKSSSKRERLVDVCKTRKKGLLLVLFGHFNSLWKQSLPLRVLVRDWYIAIHQKNHL